MRSRYDVAVVGGGSAGVAAAVGAARTGASVCLIERYPFLGGAATISSVLSYCGFFDQRREQVVAGVGGELLERLRARGAYQEVTFKWSGNTVVMIDPEFTKLALDELTAAAGVDVKLHCALVAAASVGPEVDGMTVSDHGGSHELTARSFVDASGEGDLTHLAGAATRQLDASERQSATLSMRIGGLADDAVISSDEMRRAVAAFNATHDRKLVRDHGPAARLPLSRELTMQIVDQDVDALDSDDLTRAEILARSQAWDYVEAFRASIPGWENAYLVATGPQIGIRESRHCSVASRSAGRTCCVPVVAPKPRSPGADGRSKSITRSAPLGTRRSMVAAPTTFRCRRCSRSTETTSGRQVGWSVPIRTRTARCG